jgi:hypothetical protein
MIRTDAWKLTVRHPQGPDELYDLCEDPGEARNLAGRPEHAEMERRLRERLSDFFQRHADPKYDLWNAGGSKTLLLTYPSNRARIRPDGRGLEETTR